MALNFNRIILNLMQVIAAVLKEGETVPLVREEWIMAKMRRTREGSKALTCNLNRDGTN